MLILLIHQLYNYRANLKNELNLSGETNEEVLHFKKAWSKKNNLDPASDNANMGYLLHELNEGRHWTGGGSTAELKQITDPTEAARYFMDNWERPGVPHWDRRNAAALEISKLQTGGIVDVSGSGTGDKVPAMLPEGSFVLNRKASAVLNGNLSGAPSPQLERLFDAQGNFTARVAQKGGGPVLLLRLPPPQLLSVPNRIKRFLHFLTVLLLCRLQNTSII